ncbi:MAG: hypothetical protein AVDCRST_MAG60-298, partial [uncultured Nocardioides sp.]
AGRCRRVGHGSGHRRCLAGLRRGLPRRLVRRLSGLDGPARRLYAQHGWQLLGPGLIADQV